MSVADAELLERDNELNKREDALPASPHSLVGLMGRKLGVAQVAIQANLTTNAVLPEFLCCLLSLDCLNLVPCLDQLPNKVACSKLSVGCRKPCRTHLLGSCAKLSCFRTD